MDTRRQLYTREETVEGVRVIGFVDRRPSGGDPDTTYDQDVAEFNCRMAALVEAEAVEFAVVDFSNYRMTGGDNGRAVVGTLLTAHKRLKARGGGLLVYNHPVQLNPDIQAPDKFALVIGIYRSRQDAIDAARSRQAARE
ncbi:MAG: hypothetical protein JWO38_4280 [Gemmataceae bacterium]|nr:hypothetical protein [Gemmataceae bacterium]